MARYNENHQEIPDPTPVAMPIHMQRPESLTDMMRRMIREHVSQASQEAGGETFEEANDFDIPEEDPEDTLTPYQDLGSSEELPDATPGGAPETPVQAAPVPAGGSGQPSASASTTATAAPTEPAAGRPVGA